VSASPNIDLVRSIYAAWERGDYASAEWAHREIEYVFADGPAPGTFKGLSGMAQAVGGALNAFSDMHQTADDFRELDEHRVLVLTTFAGHGKASGATVQSKGANVLHIADGQVTKLVHYWDRDRALADLGLSPEPDAPGS
jgi:ketosteroid isomerase-like protein